MPQLFTEVVPAPTPRGRQRCFQLLALLTFIALTTVTVTTVTVMAQNSFVVSPRLGEAIDAKERAYFGLFPDVVGFRSATSWSNPNGSVRFAINRELGGSRVDTTI